MEKIITIDNLIFEYSKSEGAENIRALDCVNLEIDEGSFTASIGKNGSPAWFSRIRIISWYLP